MAAEWKLLGANVVPAEPDLQLIRREHKFLVACKRPANEHNIRSNIRGAISQLNQAIDGAPSGSFGVVAISMSKILNAGDKYFAGPLDRLGRVLEQSFTQSNRHWRTAVADPRLCAVLFHVSTPADVGGGVDLSRATYTVAAPIIDSDGTKVFQEHIEAMKAAHESRQQN